MTARRRVKRAKNTESNEGHNMVDCVKCAHFAPHGARSSSLDGICREAPRGVDSRTGNAIYARHAAEREGCGRFKAIRVVRKKVARK